MLTLRTGTGKFSIAELLAALAESHAAPAGADKKVVPTVVLRPGPGAYAERGAPAVLGVSSASKTPLRADAGKFAASLRPATLKKRKRHGPRR
jgi:hypothetical protein